MNKIFLAGAALAIVLAGAPATAADFSRGAAPQAPYNAPGYYWGGAYAGFNLGYQWGDVTNFPTSPSGVAGGVQAGYLWQFGPVVAGLEGDFQGSAADDTFASFKFSNPWFGTLRGRGGVAFNNILIYLTAGLALGEGRVEFGGLTETATHVGWAAGAGVEVGLTPNWSAKAEYLYVDLASHSYILTGQSNGFESNVFRLGVNYRF
ncbi:MAG TPA: outer membrane protein [Xanthobacteraceae bacterium]|jgi:outer membrane immunogenic protein|nr:outer membrane protein [Xanthobacteraceae bacterium]